MTKSYQPKLSLTYALAFAGNLMQFEEFPNTSLKTDKVKVLFDYAELIQKEYEERTKD